MNRVAKNSLIIVALLLFVLSGVCTAEESGSGKKILSGIEFFTGFGRAKLHGKGDYYLAPLICALDFDIKPPIDRWLDKVGIKYPGLIQFQLEPFISPVYSPDANVEIGNTFMFKLGFLPQTAKFQPYVKVGAGMLYMSQGTREQSTKFNFEEQGGVGCHYFLKKNFALNADCRIRHLSNCGIDQPNHGINTLFFLLGATYQFD